MLQCEQQIIIAFLFVVAIVLLLYTMASFPIRNDGEAQVSNASTVAGISGSSNNNRTTVTTTTQPTLQYYPRDFFSTTNGAPPKNEEEAKKLWAFRKNRPGQGIIDEEPPDGKKMLNEVYAVRNNLQKFVMDAFLDGAREMANQWGLTMPDTNDFPVTEKDLQKALGSLKRTPGSLESELKAYMVAHHFH